MIFLVLFYEFFKIGLFTFGGGYAMIPLVKEIVLKYGWLTEESFYDFIGVCESTPGPIAINMATYVGTTQGIENYGIIGGIIGAIVSTLGVILPAFVVILIITISLKKIIKNKYVQYAISGINSIVLGLILSTGIIMLYNISGLIDFNTFEFDIKSLLIFILITIVFILYKLIFKKKMNNVLIVIIGAILGIITCLVV